MWRRMLSRWHEDDVAVYTLSIPKFALLDEFRVEAAALPEVIAKRAELANGTAGLDWALVDDLVVRRGRIFLPAFSSVWPMVLEHAHGMGHEGVQKTLHRLRASFTPGDNRLVRDFIRSCAVCQCNKTGHLHLAGLLQPLAVPTDVWRDIALDFVEGFPKVGGKSVILTVVDRFPKYGHSIALGHSYSAMTVAKAFFDTIVRLHGVLESIVSDRDPVFTSTLWKELFRLTGTKLCTSFAFHPQTDGQSEVANKIITAYLRCLAGDRPHSWLRWLPWAEICFNSSYQTALKATPFEVVYGRTPPPLFPYQAGMTRVVTVDRQLRDRDEFLTEIKDRLLQSHALMKQAHDQKRSDMAFAVSDWVWLCLNQRAATSVHGTGPSKLSAKFFGPYQVTTKIGSVSYRLQLPPNAKIHNVFHVV
jgi:hypothetical protein